MGFVAAKCTQCGADIRVDETREVGICEYCNTAFVTEKVINNTVTNHIYNQTFQAGAIKIQKETAEQLLSKAEAYMKIGNFSKASVTCQTACDSYPGDYRGFWGMLKVVTKNFTLLPKVFDQSFVNWLHYYIKCINILCKAEQTKKAMMSSIEAYLQKLSLEYARSDFGTFKIKLNTLEERNKNEKDRIKKLEKEASKKTVNSLIFMVLVAILMIFLFNIGHMTWGFILDYVLIILCLPVFICRQIKKKKVYKNNEPARRQISLNEDFINKCQKRNFEQFVDENKTKLSITGIINLK